MLPAALRKLLPPRFAAPSAAGGASRRMSPPGGRPWLLHALLGASLLGNLVLGSRLLGGDAPPSLPEPSVAAAADVAPTEIPVVGEPSALPNAPVPREQVPPLPEPRGVAQKGGTLHYSGAITSSLSAAFVGVEGTSPAALSAVFSRLFAWDVDFRRDIHRGDQVDVLFSQDQGVEPRILAARLVLHPGTPEEKRFEAFRFQAPGDRWASWWAPDGQEIERRLIAGPLAEYEQAATLLKLMPSRKGMDFKTPIGNAVLAPRAGTVTRVSWEKDVSGESVELRYGDGTLARFTHLNEVAVKPGQSVSAGTEVGKSGNTGRSVAAHLHYELEKGGKVLDPVTYHGTLRRQLQPDALPRFQEEAQALRSQLDAPVAAR